MDLIIGIALGAAFSKFWIMLYEAGKNALTAFNKNKS